MQNAREHILTTALQLFLQKSFKEVTLQQMVAASGLSKGAFYHYFRSKEQVFEEVIEQFFTGVRSDDFSRYAQASLWAFCQDHLAHLAQYMQRFNEQVGSDGALRANQFLLLFEALNLLPAFREHQQQRQQRELASWTAMVHQARQAGEITSGLADEQVAKVFIYLSDGAALNNLIRRAPGELMPEITQLLHGWYHTLKA